ncbi:peptidase M23-like protein [Kribbella antiqua]|uniref:Peptidase M23-like protein n=1 Tax=Kribbella antiqua TaxID=2512217 RepID=A0A4R2IC54_9ACTN|nr:M23 family metallopeptidase [Kribbella antiqua]TCO40135.1 peptidase M23-like protein [Kribbella antiqua]
MNLILLTLAFLTPQPSTETVWPLEPRPRVVHGFELPAKPWLPGHRGVDLAGSPGQPVRAATAGTITYAGQLAGRGVVVVTTGARRTTYEPIVPAVAVGAAVTPGTVIGRLSAAGSHCAPATCLHWGLLQGKQYLNPLTLLPDRPVRLLPLSAASPQPPLSAVPAWAQPEAPAGSDPPQPEVRSELSGSPPSPRGERTAAAVVGAAAVLTIAGGLMIRRH